VKTPPPSSYQKAAWVVGTILFMAAVSGYFMGLRQTGSQISLTRPVSLAVPDPARRAILETNDVPVAVSYAQQDWLRHGRNASWQNRVGKLLPTTPPAIAITTASEGERLKALQERAARRAFDGAPPIVPHPIAQESSASCLACHGPGLAVKDKVASRMSHAAYGSCTQCHVSSAGIGLPGTDTALVAALAENQFVSVPSPTRGTRAWPEAPPTIPHSTLMRSDCLSCHGPQGLFGLRTPHPDRQSCVQCHVADARLDQHVFSALFHPGTATPDARSTGPKETTSP
jgi:cytochrome c-type protein NapB